MSVREQGVMWGENGSRFDLPTVPESLVVITSLSAVGHSIRVLQFISS